MYSIIVDVSNFEILPEEWLETLFDILNVGDKNDELD